MPDLVERVKQAIFWRPVNECRIISQATDRSGIEIIEEEICKSLEDELVEMCQRPLIETMGYDGCESLDEVLDEMLWGGLFDSLQDELNDVVPGPYVKTVRASITESLWSSLYYPAGLTLSHKTEEGAKYRPLQDLWRGGHFIIGSDEADAVYILTR